MRSRMANLRHPLRGVQISDLGDKRFFFDFFHKMDIDRVLNEDPWAFNNYLLVIHRLEDGEDPIKVRMAKGLEVIEMGWYLSLKAQSRRAVAMNSVWLREEGDSSKIQGQSNMDYDLEECTIEGGDGKKRSKKDNGNHSVSIVTNSLVIRDGRSLGRTHF
ncbi:hypothetical protein CXB51_024573 [Gossypium anomalum]|uniref:DUF4283 domain-containing protein n=1 Tax=Gossypium anomalum TaxID=47600 RepID=A0A8J5Y2R6_9ROSI|nr:hypothetical protein CXB51_024573 [Gossypium anomalum]